MASNADTTGTDDTTAVEIDQETARAVRPSGDDSATVPHHNFFTRLYSGTGAFEVIGRRRLWYTISAVIVGIAVLSILVRGFTFGIDFKGGTTMSMPVAGDRGHATASQVEQVFRQTLGSDP
jgi:preprotein translocase subunit SecF